MKIIEALSVIFAFLLKLVSMYEQYVADKKAEEGLRLLVRAEYLIAKEKADAIDNAPVPTDKSVILDGM